MSTKSSTPHMVICRFSHKGILSKEILVNWNDRRQVSNFAKESEAWLRKVGHVVTTTCLAYTEPQEASR